MHLIKRGNSSERKKQRNNNNQSGTLKKKVLENSAGRSAGSSGCNMSYFRAIREARSG